MTNLLFETLWHDFSDGWSIASRTYARAMRHAGLGVQLRSWMAALEDPVPEVLAEVDGMLGELERDFYLFSCTLAGADRAAYSIDKLLRCPKPRAFYTMFERLRVEPALAESLNGCDGVMVPCSANRDALASAGCRNATYILYPYLPDDPHLSLPPPRQTPKVFYWIGRWEPRKAPHNLIRAFLRAFRPGEAELRLKLGPRPWPGYAEPEEAVAEALSEPYIAARWKTVQQVEAGIKILRGRWPASEVMALHASGDVYVSASRGEGIDLPIVAAKLAGRRIVTTDSGGPRDFLTETDIMVPRTGEVPAEPRYRWPGGVLADYNLDHLVRAMQIARGAAVLPERMDPKFHVDNVAPILRGWIEEIVARVPQEKAEPKLVGLAEWLRGES